MSVSVEIQVPAATATATAHAPSITSLLHWPLVWMTIADEHAAASAAARADFGSDPSGALTREFHNALIAIAAGAFAVEAEQLRVLGVRPAPAATPPMQAWDRNAGDWLGQFLQEMGLIDNATAADLGRMFSLRHKSVHPFAQPEALVPHPVGSNTSPELVAYNADVAAELVAVARHVVAAIASLT